MWQFCKKYLLNIDVLIVVCVVIVTIYFICTAKKKKYKFDLRGVDLRRKAKKPRKKRVNKHEEECRRIFERIFSKRFKSTRPNWLKNPATKKNLELDGYNPTVVTPMGEGLAFEYDGAQHSRYVPHFHQNGPVEFEYQVAKDSWKDQKCKERGVMLIRIPHFVVMSDLERYIRRALAMKKVMIPPQVTQGSFY